MRTMDRGFTPDAHPCRGYGFWRCTYDDCPSNSGPLAWCLRTLFWRWGRMTW